MSGLSMYDPDDIYGLLDCHATSNQTEGIFDDFQTAIGDIEDDDYAIFLNDIAGSSDLDGYGQDLALRQDISAPQEESPVQPDPAEESIPVRADSVYGSSNTGDQALLGFHDISRNKEEAADVVPPAPPVQVEAQLGGRIGFPDHKQEPSSKGSEPVELTFYRRNLFKISGTVHVPAECISTKLDRNIVSLSARLDAVESTEGATAKIVRIPIRPDAMSGETAAREEQVLPVLLDHRQSKLTSICWDRLQFRRATIKTRGNIAQRYQLRITIVATLDDRSEKAISRVASEFIVVRGRSPKNYPEAKARLSQVKSSRAGAASRARRESIQTTSSPERKNSAIARKLVPAQSRTLNIDPSEDLLLRTDPQPRKKKPDDGYQVTDLDLYSDGSEVSIPADVLAESFDFQTFEHPKDMEEVDMSSAFTAIADASWDKADVEEQPGEILLPTISNEPTATTDRTTIVMGASGKSDTCSYEYIPLSINDWTVPVDPVYRPHGVHHKTVKDQFGRSAARKRYFIDVK